MSVLKFPTHHTAEGTDIGFGNITYPEKLGVKLVAGPHAGDNRNIVSPAVFYDGKLTAYCIDTVTYKVR